MLNVYAERPEAFDHEAEKIGHVLASHLAFAGDAVIREEQFRSALATRDTIGQAKAILMARFDIDSVQAFKLLTRLSQGQNVKVVEIARRITELAPLEDL